MNPIVHLSPVASARGITNTGIEGGVSVHSFLGIPYAQPPVGDLRFQAPQPCELWEGERDFTKYGAVCPQDLEMTRLTHEPFFPNDCHVSEDCLFLNVTSPRLDQSARLPVMFWIHGGGFALGFSDMYRGDALCALNEVVFVSCNYRVGPLGFMTSGDDVMPGNQGLLDQVEALKWVRKHIAAFGGDPDNVTIFGESAGGTSVSYHVISDVTRGLFKRAICQSGVATCPLSPLSKEHVRKLLAPHLSKLGFESGSSEDMLKFLRQKSPDELLAAFPMEAVCLPVIDGTFLSGPLRELYKNGRFHDVPLMCGVNSHEGNLFVNRNGLRSPEKPLPSADDFREHFKTAVSPVFHERLDAVADELVKLYVKPDVVGDRQMSLEAYCDFYSDFVFTGANHFTALNHSKSAPCYSYLFAQRPPYSAEEDWVVADHAQEVYYVLGAPFGDVLPEVHAKEEDKLVSRLVMAYWANFARTGDPNGPGLEKWSSFTSENTSYMLLNEKPQLKMNFEPERMEFWVKCDGQI